MSGDIRRYFGISMPKDELKAETSSKTSKSKTSRKTKASDGTDQSNAPPTKRPKRATVPKKNPVVVDLAMSDEEKEVPKAKAKKSTKKVKFADEQEMEPKPTSSTRQQPVLDLRTPSMKLDQWVDKYRPTTLKELIGQHTEQAPAKKLLRWLKDWPRNHLSGISNLKKPKATSGPGANDGSSCRAALLSGPPGIGKTTTARLVCEELNLHYIELNASDARSKRLLEQGVNEMLHSQKIDDFFGGTANKGKIVSKDGHKITSVLIMDEVDGMSGNQDRSGITELIAMIKKTEIPIICICNDRYSKKIRSLANHCFDLRYTPPTVPMILSRMLTVLHRENVKVTKEDVEKVIQASNQDIRQSIYSLQLLAAGRKKSNELVLKDCAVNTFEAAHRLLGPKTNLIQKRDLFFMDYTLMPLFVQEMYLNVRNGKWGKRAQLFAQSLAAESIAIGDIISRQIYSSQTWALLPLKEFGKVCSTSQIEKFPECPVHDMQLLRTIFLCCDNESFNHCWAMSRILIYHAYGMIREDFETINELGMWNENDDKWKRVAATTKSALTRALNNDTFKFSYATDNGIQIFAKEDIGESAKGKRKAGKRVSAKAAKEQLKKIAKTEEEEQEEDTSDDEPEAEVIAEIINA
ncbi:AAA domain-containing protein [Aphelenchoides besseyi]|nr:AAA domain-containing protein [Aphelenchoides besseyi]KAI6200170.1 AAA domain-containing protein [Aphelenchoides besseyi]